ncbi:hypothetical protein LK12_22975 [Novosphingobium malaysiense]|uniref:3-oxoacyl-ACP reductase n=2 Tax=Novosphingobium malaysiense TaxID=1348853 RepID=A0A0B1ZEL6_9SPHN|nr:hypothetical protein LK12_22975 [Novosphingobium malaysiense]
MDFDGCKVIVTGGSSGIGLAVVDLFVERGAKVVSVGRSQEKLAAQADRLGAPLITHACDVGVQEEAEAMLEQSVARLGGLDILINNAGVGGVLKRVGELDPADWRATMAVNCDSVFWISRLALPHLIESKGCIVNTASLAGMAANHSFTTYNVSKHALIALTQCMALDYAADGVRVNCISPGYVATDLNRLAPPQLGEAFIERTPMGRAADPGEIAEAILFLASSKASYISGHNLVVDGAMMASAGLPNVPKIIAGLMKG